MRRFPMDFWWQNSGVQFWWGCMFAQFLDCVCFGGNKLKCLLPLLRIFHIFKKHISFALFLYLMLTSNNIWVWFISHLGGIQFSFFVMKIITNQKHPSCIWLLFLVHWRKSTPLQISIRIAEMRPYNLKSVTKCYLRDDPSWNIMYFATAVA